MERVAIPFVRDGQTSLQEKKTDMTFDKALFAAATVLAVFAVPSGGAMAQQRGTQAQRAQNAQATADMRSRLAAADDRIVAHQRRGKVPPARAAEMRRDLTKARQDLERFNRQQGFVSAAQLASYGRMVVAIDDELGKRANERSYGNDALPSAEVIAFQRTDARLHYRNARIEYDRNNCAVYQGVGPGGRTRSEPLRDAAGKAICTRR